MNKSPIVFTTEINSEIRYWFNEYHVLPRDSKNKAKAFLKFAEICEKHKRNVTAIADELLKEL